jgi:hypothetical protein
LSTQKHIREIRLGSNQALIRRTAVPIECNLKILWDAEAKPIEVTDIALGKRITARSEREPFVQCRGEVATVERRDTALEVGVGWRRNSGKKECRQRQCGAGEQISAAEPRFREPHRIFMA